MMEERREAEAALGRARGDLARAGDAPRRGGGDPGAGTDLFPRERTRGLEYLEEARELLKASEDPLPRRRSRTRWAALLRHGEIETALGHYLRALELNRAHPFKGARRRF
jgi:hypothetical protein